jgi:hypothetical protein
MFSKINDEHLTTMARAGGELLQSLRDMVQNDEVLSYIEVLEDLMDDAMAEIELRWCVPDADEPVESDWMTADTELVTVIGKCERCGEFTVSGTVCANCASKGAAHA